jgi:hypothetical protein
MLFATHACHLEIMAIRPPFCLNLPGTEEVHLESRLSCSRACQLPMIVSEDGIVWFLHWRLHHLPILHPTSLASSEGFNRICYRLQIISTNFELLNQTLTTSELIYLQWQSRPSDPAYQSNTQAMVNGMLFERQQCKMLMECFLKSSAPYTNAFLTRRQNAIV